MILHSREMPAGIDVQNARIWTGWSHKPWAAAIVIRGGKVAVLDEACERGEVVIDAGGRTVVPGLIDAHLHLLSGGRSLAQLDLSQVRSRRGFEQAVARRHAELPAGKWLIAGGWSQENWPGGEMPAKDWLAVAEDRPVVCYRMDMHAAVVNDPVLARCDLSADPPGGRIVRDRRTGEPTGLFIESAAWKLINPIVPPSTASEKRDALLAAQRHAHRLGLTAVGTMEYADDLLEVYASLRRRLTLRSRVTLLDRAWPMDFDVGRGFAGDERLAVIGYKTFVDGTLGSHTARMLAEYADDPGNRGMLVELAAAGHLPAWAAGVAACGLSPSMHAIGDEAVRLALDVVESIGAGVRPRIEHAQQIDEADLPRFAGVIASMQPLHKADDGRYLERRLGQGRLAGSYAFRRLLEARAHLAFGSDWPVVSCDPLAGIRAAVTGLTGDGRAFLPDQNLTVEEALRAYTAGAANALRLDDAGVLRPGALGDLVMIDRDPFSADWVETPPQVVLTIAGGRIVHDER